VGENSGSDKDYLSQSREDAKVTGRRPSSRTDVRDLRKISPFGRNDNKYELCAFAPWREIFRIRANHSRRRVEDQRRAMLLIRSNFAEGF
jgi:hypothetical protein